MNHVLYGQVRKKQMCKKCYIYVKTFMPITNFVHKYKYSTNVLPNINNTIYIFRLLIS